MNLPKNFQENTRIATENLNNRVELKYNINYKFNYKFTSPVVKQLYNNIHPQQKTPQAVGFDLLSIDTFWLNPNEIYKIPTGICLDMGDKSNFFGLLTLRSSITDVILTNGVGIIDPDYQGEIMFSVRNIQEDSTMINTGQRIGQIVFIPYIIPNWNQVEEFSTNTIRGTGGFGSTGI